jgi:rhodanese-related sulfurtransferase
MAKKTSRAPVNKKTTPVWIWALLAVIVLAVIGGIVYSQMTPAAASIPDEISVAQAAAKRDQGAFILDVREQSEWDQFHIPDATLIPLGQLSSRLNELPKDKEIVVVCRTGHRSAQGRDILRQAGFTNVTSMAGGVTEWQNQGLAIATGP